LQTNDPVVFSSNGKQIGKSYEKRFKEAIEKNVKAAFGVFDGNSKDKDIILYKGLFELQGELLDLKEEEKYERIFSYFQDNLKQMASIMYVFQDKYYVPVKYNNVTFVKPLVKNVFNHSRKVEIVNIDKSSFLFNEIGVGEVIIIRPSNKAIFIYKIVNNDLSSEFLNSLLDILGKFLND